MIERIQKILKSKHLSPSQFADQIQVQRSSVSHILSGRNKASLDFVMKVLSSYPDVDAEWLLFGKGKITKENNSSSSSTQLTEENPGISSPHDNNKDNDNIKNDKILKSEKSVYYGQRKKIKKIVVLYHDSSFEEYLSHSDF